jgi:Ca2+-binding EF-hand superfamily protein
MTGTTERNDSMKSHFPSRPLLMSLLLLGALPVAGCGSAAAAGDTETSAQAVTLPNDGVVPVASANPSDSPRGGHHGRKHGWFRKFDADGDGRIALTDVPEHKRAHVAAADANHDGFITRDEMHAMKQSKVAQMKAEADTNHDGTVSDEERKAAHMKFAEKRFLKHDTNGDRALTADEVSAKKWERVKKADANGDGRVTTEEFVTAAANGTLGRFHGHKHHRDGASTGTKPVVL